MVKGSWSHNSTSGSLPYILSFTQAFTRAWLYVTIIILQYYSGYVGVDFLGGGLRMVINITCFKIPGSGFIFVASEYPSITNKEIILYYLPKPLFVYVFMVLILIVELYS